MLAIVLVGTLVLTAFGSGQASPAPATAAQPQSALLPAGPPEPQVVAARNGLRLQLPSRRARLTAIGYHDAGAGALTLDPVGRRGNRGLLGRLADRMLGRDAERAVWYQLGGGATSALDVGAAPGTDVFSPVDGVVVGDRRPRHRRPVRGARIDIEPTDAPSLVVSVSRVRPDPSLASARRSSRPAPGSAPCSTCPTSSGRARALHAGRGQPRLHRSAPAPTTALG